MKWLAAAVCAVAASVSAAVTLGLLFRHLTPAIAWISLAAGAAAAAAAFIQCRPALSRPAKFGFWSWAAVVAFAIIVYQIIFWMLFAYKGRLYALRSGSGELSYHLSLIQHLADGCRFWPENPIIAGERLSRPYGMDLFNALAVMAGADIVKSVLWTGLISCVVVGIALLAWGGAFTLAGFTLAGGLSGLAFLTTFNILAPLSETPWGSMLTGFVLQRAALYAYPAGLLLLICWRRRFFSNGADRLAGTLPLWAEALIYASMPFFEIVTFLYLSALLAFWTAAGSPAQRRRLLHFFKFSAAPALFSFFLMTRFMTAWASEGISWDWQLKTLSSFVALLVNFGVFLPMMFGAFILLVLDRSKKNASKDLSEDAAFVVPAFFSFIIFCLFLNGRYSWDLLKFHGWPYLLLLPYIWRRIVSPRSVWARNMLCAALFFSGSVYAVQEAVKFSPTALYETADVREIHWALRGMPAEGRFAVFPTHNHLVTFAGGKIVAGDPWYLSVCGHSDERKGLAEKVNRLMMGDPQWRALAGELDVRYIFWGRIEEENYKTSSRPWESTAPLIASGPWGKIYDLGKRSAA